MDSIYSGNIIRVNNAHEVLLLLKSPLIGDRLNEIIDFMLSFANKKILNKVYKYKNFKDLCDGVIDLN